MKLQSSFAIHSWSLRACHVHHWPEPVISHPKYRSCLCLACAPMLWLFWILLKKSKNRWNYATLLTTPAPGFPRLLMAIICTSWMASSCYVTRSQEKLLPHFHPETPCPFSFFLFQKHFFVCVFEAHIYLCFCVQRIERFPSIAFWTQFAMSSQSWPASP